MEHYFADYLSPELLRQLPFEKCVPGDSGIELVPLDYELRHSTAFGAGEQQELQREDQRTAASAAATFESAAALQFVAQCFRAVRGELDTVLRLRAQDRAFVDAALHGTALPAALGPVNGPLGQAVAEDSQRVPFGPLHEGHSYRSGEGRARVAPLPPHLQGVHVTLFGPADGVRQCAYALNCLDRKLPGEPPLVAQVLQTRGASVPMWGADDEDSRTPLRTGMLASLSNLLNCFRGELPGAPPLIAPDRRATPIKRVPGLAIPAYWMRVDGCPVPLHLLDLCLHLFYSWPIGERALTFYFPKLETEHEARYLAALIAAAEDRLPAQHRRGSTRVLVVLENPRAVFRINEIMDALYPYFAGASLGWHDYVAASARLFRNDLAYRIPAKADAHIVVKHIRESHLLLANVVKARGGVAIGGMYGVLPVQGAAALSIKSDSMQVCIRGMIRDIVVQFRRGLEGLWVAHPDFVRLSMSIVLAYRNGQTAKDGFKQLRALIHELVTDPAVADSLCALIETRQEDDAGLDPKDPLYARALLAAELGGAGATIQNNDEEEVRYNTFQALQYLTDWLIGNGCVALPAELPHPSGKPGLNVIVRVMDDLATTERSRWEVALEVYHGRVKLEHAVQIAREEMLFFRTAGKYGGASGGGSRIAAIPWHDVWSPIAYRIWLLLISPPQDRRTVIEFATELLLTFTVSTIRNAPDVWAAAAATSNKFKLPPRTALLDALFSACLSPSAVGHVLEHGVLGPDFSLPASESRRAQVAAKVLTALDPLAFNGELDFSKRVASVLQARFTRDLQLQSPTATKRWVLACQRAVADGGGCFFGAGEGGLDPVRDRLQIASLSKPIGSAYALEYFARRKIPLNTPVAALLRRLNSPFVLECAPGVPAEWAEQVTLEHLMSHCSGLGQHYVHSFPVLQGVPPLLSLMRGLTTDLGGKYDVLRVVRKPGVSFAYSGGGFILLQYVLELMENKPINEQIASFLAQLGMDSSARIQDDGSGAMVYGVMDDGRPMPRRAFPGIAAGAVCTARDTLNFLRHLVAAFDPSNVVRGSGPISHATAVKMLGAPRREITRDARNFIACDVGCGLFIGQCGDNRIAIHQGANEGFRGMFVACYAGPAAGAIVVSLGSCDKEGVPTLAHVARNSLVSLGVLSQSAADALSNRRLSLDGIPQETIVNQSMKALLFDAFVPTPLAPPPRLSQEPHPMVNHDLLHGASVVFVSNDTFAQAPNLVDPAEPFFDPRAFGPMGKVMDSWESVRHNPSPFDEVILKLARPAAHGFKFAEVSTKWHDGNQCPAVSLAVASALDGKWTEILPISPLIAHGMHRFVLQPTPAVKNVQFVRVCMFPDGGLTRLRLYDETLPKQVWGTFPFEGRFKDAIPPVDKANALFAKAEASTVSKDQALRLMRNAVSSHDSDMQEVNVLMGGSVVKVSNEHYGSASSILSPFPPRGMFDGFETRRARAADPVAAAHASLKGEDPLRGKKEFVEVKFSVPAVRLRRVEVDFTFFVNNNPARMSIEGTCDGGSTWHVILAEVTVKHFRGNVMTVDAPFDLPPLTGLRVNCFPCGGFNRLRAFASVGEVRNAIIKPKL